MLYTHYTVVWLIILNVNEVPGVWGLEAWDVTRIQETCCHIISTGISPHSIDFVLATRNFRMLYKNLCEKIVLHVSEESESARDERDVITDLCGNIVRSLDIHLLQCVSTVVSVDTGKDLVVFVAWKQNKENAKSNTIRCPQETCTGSVMVWSQQGWSSSFCSKKTCGVQCSGNGDSAAFSSWWRVNCVPVGIHGTIKIGWETKCCTDERS